MPTSWTIIFRPQCDRCGESITFEGQSKPEALKMAQAAGWYIDAHTVCPECREKEGK